LGYKWGAKILYFEKKLVTQKMAWSLDHKDWVGPQNNTSSVGDIPNRYTSDVVLNQQARVAHQGGMADCCSIPVF
jgi:hypothetical protein